MSPLDVFREIWVVDFEFGAPPGARPTPVCMVAAELRSGRRLACWQSELATMVRPPFDTGPQTLIVAYYASAELGCFLALGWGRPANVLDLYAEFRCMTNGRPTPSGWGLLGALVAFGLDGMTAAEKDANRDLVMRGGPFTEEERERILRYCAADVDATLQLLRKMENSLQPQALLRGRYMMAAASMEWCGVPIDTGTLGLLRARWPTIQDELIRQVDAGYGVYEGRTFKMDRFARWLHERGLQWPILESGRLSLDDDTFRAMAKVHPELQALHELRVSLSKMRLLDLSVGPDGRNRTLLSAYGSRSSRNQPSNTRFIFGPATWLRGLIQPPPGMALGYVDYSQQEFGIAAALSGDRAMQEAYLGGDPYLGFAKAAKAVPPDATKKTHPLARERFKATTLGVQYGMSEVGLASQLGVSVMEARDLLRLHRTAFPQYWKWNDAAADFAMLNGHIHTVFGWTLHVTPDTKPRSVRNFPMQSNGAEILRLACCLATERGIAVCAPIHDALLVEGPADSIQDVVAATQQAMREAGEIVLGGFPLASDAKTVRHPDRYMDPRGAQMWDTVMDLLAGGPASGDPPQLCEETPSSHASPA